MGELKFKIQPKKDETGVESMAVNAFRISQKTNN